MSNFSEIRIATPALFWFPLTWNIIFHPFPFILYVSLSLKWVSCRQHIYGSCFCVHSVSLYLLVTAFNPSIETYVSIITYVPIGILSVVFCFCRSFLSLVFTGYISSFSICCKTGLFVLNSLNFCLSVKLFYFSINF